MKVLVTGADGFLGRNICTHLSNRSEITVVKFTREDHVERLKNMIEDTDFIFHLAGVNRPKTSEEYFAGNSELTKILCEAINKSFRKIPIVFSSSLQAGKDSLYGSPKFVAEQHLISLKQKTDNPLYIFRLPNVFGKWAKPNYNSVVATFCYNISHGLPIDVHDPKKIISMVYVDDVVGHFLKIMDGELETEMSGDYQIIRPEYSISVGNLAETIKSFNVSGQKGKIDNVGHGLLRALYSTFASYLSPENFSYNLVKNHDARGSFVEVIKTVNCGQVSYFTAPPGTTRGGHYHHSKTEKFLVVKGEARFRFKNVLTLEEFNLSVDYKKPTVVQTVPGWAHDITNIGSDEVLVLLWANEVFDKRCPDTFPYEVFSD